MRWPFVIVALLYSDGVILGNYLLTHLLWLLVLSFILAFLALASHTLRLPALALLLPLAGWTNLASRTALLSPIDLRTLLGSDPALVELRGALSEAPVLRPTAI